MPPLVTIGLQRQVLLHAMPIIPAGILAGSEGKHWSGMLTVSPNPPATFKIAVAELVAPGDSDLDKARKIYKPSCPR